MRRLLRAKSEAVRSVGPETVGPRVPLTHRCAATHRRVLCLEFFRMFRVVGECLEFFVMFSFSECLGYFGML